MMIEHPDYEEVFVDVKTTATNKIINISDEQRSSAEGIKNFLHSVIAGQRKLTRPGYKYISGDYKIHARLCRPHHSVALPEPTVQVLVHGLAYDKGYWSGLRSAPDHLATSFSWERTATTCGYYTLNIDRLGSGQSSRPDPIDELQDDCQSAVLHEIYQQLRMGCIGRQKFERIIHVGHSYGSILGSIVSEQYPQDFDHLVMTGWARVDLPVEGNGTFGEMMSACDLRPEKFGHLHPGYLIIGRSEVRASSCFTGELEADMVAMDWDVQEPTGIGEWTSETIVSHFRGDVFVLQGEKDLALVETRELQVMDASEVAATRGVFPNAKTVDWYLLPDTGHCVALHSSSQHGADVVHEWLAKVRGSKKA
ncbi:alpha/beta-hydrolase [Lophiostoma macrostomum CBS 122681]|uniref:Alpha/beta-hydrolase n=1 Tax=Lophiostoma macrostomum CBS 122681 TaxID=1314788 RepID=A0A6A6SJH8_9PLEO|nr:alpha/beta-hydrolase [Lophiostoma macrostomum CBS 122681]